MTPIAPARAAVWGIGLCALAYVVSRGLLLSMTCDEAWSASPLPLPSLTALLSDKAIAALNNHLLNSLLMQLSVATLGQHDWAVRLPALCGGALAIACACRLSLTLTDSWRSPALAVLLLGNPYLLDFLSLARGYSLGLGFMLLGLCGLLRAGTRGYAWSPLPMALAVLSNLSFVYAYLASLGVTAWLTARNARHRGLAATLADLAPALASLALLAWTYTEALRLAVSQNEHWWGSTAGFVDGSLASLVRVSLYEPHLPDTTFIALAQGLAAGLVAAMLLGAWSARCATQPDGSREAFGRLCAMVLLIWAGVVTEHTLFGTPYLVERATLFLHPLFALLFALSERTARHSKRLAALAAWLLGALTLACLANTLANANLSRTSTWLSDACARDFLGLIDERNSLMNFTHETITLATTTVHEHTVHYYLTSRRMAYVRELLPDQRRLEAQYLLTDREEARRLLQQGLGEELLVCPADGSALLRLRN